MIKFLEVKRAYYADPENVVVQYQFNDCGDDTWYSMNAGVEPPFDTDKNWRIRPRTIRIGDIDVPEPVREALKDGDLFFVPYVISEKMADGFEWTGHEKDLFWLSRGLIHLTKEAAIEHAKALIIVSGGKV